jgi:translocation and assembly module TamA
VRTTPRLRLAVACAALALAGCAVRLKRGTAERPAITSFEIDGTHAVSAGDLVKRLATEPSDRFFWRFFWRETRYYDEDAFANDKRRILRYYQSIGYYGAKVTAADVLPDGDGFVKVRVRVEEGAPTRVVDLVVDGLDAAPEAKSKAGKLPLRVGDVFTEAAYDATRAALLAALTSTGWAKAEVAQSAQVDPLLAEARVRYTVQPNERYRFGNVFVAGAAAVPRGRIREEAEQVVKPGDVYDATDLGKAQGRVYDLGVFGGVRVSPGPADEGKKTLPVVVAVREAPFRTVRAGPGITVQYTRQELDLMAGWAHRNWLGGLRKLQLDARIGYAWLPRIINPTKSNFVGLATADFTQPDIVGRRVDLNVRAELERGLEPAYDFFAERLRVGLPTHFYGRLVSFTPSVNLELYQLSAGLRQAGVGTGPAPGTPPPLNLATCPGHNPNLCLLSYFEQRLALDLRDDPITTHRGFYFAVSLQEGFSAFGNGSSYLRLLPEARAFASLPDGFVLAGRLRLGLVNVLKGSSDVPIVAKFTSGGPNFMRAYYTRDLSPVFPFVQNGTLTYLAVGGNGLIDGSAELRFPLSGSLSGALFLDFGDVRLSAAESLDLRNLQYGAGVGLRYNTLFGPVRVDLASRLPTARGQDRWPGVQVVQITDVGGVSATGAVHHPPIVSVHLSIGEAF